jgi:hypothetical protein
MVTSEGERMTEFGGIHTKILRLLVISSQTSPIVLAMELNINCCSVELNLHLQNQFHAFIIISICHESYTWQGNATTNHFGTLGAAFFGSLQLSLCRRAVTLFRAVRVLQCCHVLEFCHGECVVRKALDNT